MFAWKSKLQTIAAASSVEDEYIALSKCVGECLWVRKTMRDFKFDVHATDIRCENQGAIALNTDNKMNEATQHIGTWNHLVPDYAEKKLVLISYVLSQNMIANGMTKPLRRLKLKANVHMYGLQTKSI